MLQHQLEEILQSHRLNSVAYKEWILVNGELPGITVSVENEQKTANGYTLQLNVVLFFNSETTIIESFGGIGTSKEAAIANAFSIFSANSLHVLMTAFWKPIQDAQVEEIDWEINGIRWRVLIGSYGVRTFDGSDIRVPQTVFLTLERLIQGLNLEGDLYWLRTFYCDTGNGNGNKIVEVLLNNNPWEYAQDEIKKLNWPKTGKYYSVRNFIIFQKIGSEVK